MPHGTWSDSPPAHNLDYFRLDPCLRSDRKYRFLQCAEPASASELEARLKTHTNLSLVGKIGAFTIYDLDYFLSGDNPGPGARSVLIETAPNQLHEIHVRGNMPKGTLFPTEILRVRQLSILKMKFDDGGIYHGVNEDFYIILESGALLLDFDPVFHAASKVIPNGMVTWQPTSRFDFESLVFHIRTEKRDVNVGPKVACCEGRIEVPFGIEQGHIVPGDAKYFPE